jgi:hypothetical protein
LPVFWMNKQLWVWLSPRGGSAKLWSRPSRYL